MPRSARARQLPRVHAPARGGRYEDHPALDFSRVESQPDVHFAHKSGFMCKTTASDPARLQELVTLAWRR